MKQAVLTLLAGLLLFASACSGVNHPSGSGGPDLTERQRAKRFARIIANYEDHHVVVVTGQVLGEIDSEARTCDVAVPQAQAPYELGLEEAVQGLIETRQLLNPYGAAHAQMAALHPRTRALRTLVSASALQLQEARKLSKLPEPDYCTVLHGWQRRHWRGTFPRDYYLSVLRRYRVDYALMRKQARRAGGTLFPLTKLGLSFNEAIHTADGMDFHL